MYQLGVIGLLWAFTAFMVLAGLIAFQFSRHSKDQGKKVKQKRGVSLGNIIGTSCFVLAAVINSGAAYLAYKFNSVVEGFAGMLFGFAINAAAFLSVGLVIYLMVSTIMLMVPQKSKRGLT